MQQRKPALMLKHELEIYITWAVSMNVGYYFHSK